MIIPALNFTNVKNVKFGLKIRPRSPPSRSRFKAEQQPEIKNNLGTWIAGPRVLQILRIERLKPVKSTAAALCKTFVDSCA